MRKRKGRDCSGGNGHDYSKCYSFESKRVTGNGRNEIRFGSWERGETVQGGMDMFIRSVTQLGKRMSNGHGRNEIRFGSWERCTS